MYASLSAFVHERASRSVALCEGLRAALVHIKQPGLAKIVDLIQSDATAASCAARLTQAHRAAHLDRRTISDLKRLAALGGHSAIPLAQRICSRLATRLP